MVELFVICQFLRGNLGEESRRAVVVVPGSNEHVACQSIIDRHVFIDHIQLVSKSVWVSKAIVGELYTWQKCFDPKNGSNDENEE